MNKREVITAVAERSGVTPEDCAKVLDTFEDVFSEEITHRKWKGSVFEFIYDVMTCIKNKKNKQVITQP